MTETPEKQCSKCREFWPAELVAFDHLVEAYRDRIKTSKTWINSQTKKAA
jgi:hypothetical protein